MSQILEKEIKTALTQSHYNLLFEHFRCQDKTVILQENVYFDTYDFQLKQRNAGLRYRLANDTVEFTLKEKISPTDTIETTDDLSSLKGR